MKFEDADFTTYDRYSSSYTSRYRLEKADISYIDDQITGEVRFYSLSEKEPDRPMYVCLKKVSNSFEEQDSNDNSKIYAYPNPFVESFNLNFELDKDVNTAKICIFTQSGLNKLNYGIGSLQAGKHSFTISPNIANGTYIGHVLADEYEYQTIIFKK